MKIRAAVLEEFAQPLNVTEVDLAEPKPGEVLVRLEACGVCHTDMYTASGVDPSGYAPTVLGPRGRGVVERSATASRASPAGDHVVTLFSPQCRECVHCLQPATRTCAWPSASSRTRATSPTAPPVCRATASRSATSWARAPSPSTP